MKKVSDSGSYVGGKVQCQLQTNIQCPNRKQSTAICVIKVFSYVVGYGEFKIIIFNYRLLFKRQTHAKGQCRATFFASGIPSDFKTLDNLENVQKKDKTLGIFKTLAS